MKSRGGKGRIEETVRSLKFPSHVILRPVFFMENLLLPWFIQGDKLMAAIKPDTSLQMIAVADIGKYGALAFENAEKLNRDEIILAGDAVTIPHAAALLGEAMGKKVDSVPLPIAEVRKYNEDVARMFEWFDRVGYDADIAGNEKKYGIKPTKLAD